MPWTARGELQKLQKGQYLDIPTDIPEDSEDPSDRTAQEQQHTRGRLLIKRKSGSSRKRSGKQHGNATTSYNAVSEGQSSFTGWTGLEVQTDRSTTQCCQRISTFTNRASHSSGHERSKPTSFSRSRKKVDNPYASSVYLLRNDWR